MIDAEMYGMIPSAKIEKRDSAPPENTLKQAENSALLRRGTARPAPTR